MAGEACEDRGIVGFARGFFHDNDNVESGESCSDQAEALTNHAAYAIAIHGSANSFG